MRAARSTRAARLPQGPQTCSGVSQNTGLSEHDEGAGPTGESRLVQPLRRASRGAREPGDRAGYGALSPPPETPKGFPAVAAVRITLSAQLPTSELRPRGSVLLAGGRDAGQ